MWIGALVLFVMVVGAGWWVGRMLKQKEKSNELSAFAAVVRRGKCLRVEIRSARQDLARQAQLVDDGFQLSDDARGEGPDADGEDDGPDEPELPVSDPHLLAVLRLLTQKMRVEEGKITGDVQRHWKSYEDAIRRYEKDPQPSRRRAAETELVFIEALKVDLEALAKRIDRSACEEILSRYRAQKGVYRDRLVAQIERGMKRLAAPGLEFPDVEEQRPGMLQYLGAFDEETATEETWGMAREVSLRVEDQLRQHIDGLEERARQRLTLKSLSGLVERGIASSKRRLEALVAEGYHPQAGSADAAVRPLEEGFAAWKVRYDAGVPLTGDREGLHVLRDRLLVFEQHHVSAWAFYQARVAVRGDFFARLHRLTASFAVVEQGSGGAAMMDEARRELLERIRRTLQEAKEFHDTLLRPFASLKEPPAEAAIVAVRSLHDRLDTSLDELIAATSTVARRLRGVTGSFPVGRSAKV